MGEVTAVTIFLCFALIAPAVYFNAVDRAYERYFEPADNALLSTRVPRENIVFYGDYPTPNKDAFALCNPDHTHCAVFGVPLLPDRVEIRTHRGEFQVHAYYHSSVLFYLGAMVFAAAAFLFGIVATKVASDVCGTHRVFESINKSPDKSVEFVTDRINIRYDKRILTISDRNNKVVFCGTLESDYAIRNNIPAKDTWFWWDTVMKNRPPSNMCAYVPLMDIFLVFTDDGGLLVTTRNRSAWMQFKACNK